MDSLIKPLPNRRHGHAIPRPGRRAWPWACLLLLAPFPACQPNEKKLAEDKSSLLKEIDLPSLTESLPSSPRPAGRKPDDPNAPWIDADSLPIDRWEIQYIGNRPVGYMHRHVEKISDGNLSLQAHSHTYFPSNDGPVSKEIELNSTEKPNGELVQMKGSETMIQGQPPNRFAMKIEEEPTTEIMQLHMVTWKGQVWENIGKSSSKIPWTERDRGPFAIEQSLVRTPMQEGEIRELKYFDPIQAKMISVRLEALDYFDTAIFDGSKKKLLEIEVTSTIGDQVGESQLWVDEKGVAYKSYFPAIDLRTFRCDASTAKWVVDQVEVAKRVDDAKGVNDFQPYKRDGIKLNEGSVRMFTEGEVGAVKFTLERFGSTPLPEFSSRTNQVARKKDDRHTEIVVYPSTLLDQPIPDLEPEPVPDPETLQPSPLLDSDHPTVAGFATAILEQAALEDPPSPRDRALALRRGVFQRLGRPRPFDGWVPKASETLAVGPPPASSDSPGPTDAYDHAFLLAASLRSAAIPARIALGLRYEKLSAARSEMKMHPWVEFHDGQRWIPIDSTSDEVVVPAFRIKWSEFAFANRNPYEKILELQKMLGSDFDLEARPWKP